MIFFVFDTHNTVADYDDASRWIRRFCYGTHRSFHGIRSITVGVTHRLSTSHAAINTRLIPIERALTISMCVIIRPSCTTLQRSRMRAWTGSMRTFRNHTPSSTLQRVLLPKLYRGSELLVFVLLLKETLQCIRRRKQIKHPFQQFVSTSTFPQPIIHGRKA